VVGHEADKIEEVLQGQPVRFVENTNYMEGMTSSIQTGYMLHLMKVKLDDLPF